MKLNRVPSYFAITSHFVRVVCYVITDITTSKHSSLQNEQLVLITKVKCDRVVLQSATSVITKCDRYYKVGRFYKL